MTKPRVICCFGPTGIGKTQFVLQLAERCNGLIISVDSALVYRGMDIGTAKPLPSERQRVPHALIDICDASEIYSAGDFVLDAKREIDAALASGQQPILAGGTMMYFNVLRQGIAALPTADQVIRQQLSDEASRHGWEKLHQRLQVLDFAAAKKIHPNDKQRIQRALEVYELTSMPISVLQQQAKAHAIANDYDMVYIALVPKDRAWLHGRVAQRFHSMMAAGFIEEVQHFYGREDMSANLPSMRSVGYRQAWAYLAGEISKETMQEQAITATRQLVKRQLTWLRSWKTHRTYYLPNERLLEQVEQELGLR